jgi:SnoaL-like domain
MRKLILLGFAAILFAACSNPGPPRWTTTAPEIDVAKALLKDYQDGNWESWMSHYADTAKVFHNTIVGATPKQLQEALSADIQKLSSYHFSDKDIYYERIIDDDGQTWVYFWGTWEATVATTNKQLVVPVHLDLHFVDGKIGREYGYYDYSSLMTAWNELAAAEKPE